MKTSGIFDESRFRVLRCLYIAEDRGVSVRELSYRSEISLNAVQTALRSLMNCGLVCSQSVNEHPRYVLETKHRDFSLVEALINSMLERDIREGALSDSLQNEGTLALLSSMWRFAERIKQSGTGSAVSKNR